MTAAQFKEEVSRRLGEEVKKLDESAKPARRPMPRAAPARGHRGRRRRLHADAYPTVAVVVPVEPTRIPSPTATPEPVRETLPSILKIVKPAYPVAALQARIGGIGS
jgi:hypothetical protein